MHCRFMNGPIAQLVALTCHGNAFLRRGGGAPFFPDNSTCKFCDRVTFAELRRRWFGSVREESVATSPDEWFAYLSQTGVQGLRLSHRARGNPLVSDRMSAGLIGGGAVWTIAAPHGESIDHCAADWVVWNQHASAQRIWRVTYRLIASLPKVPPASDDVARAGAELTDALQRIHAFAKAHDCAPFTDRFRRALESLAEPFPTHGYHTDLCPDGVLTASARALLDASQSAWVFGGMGSWNDLGFDGDAGRECEEVSARLCAAVHDAIRAAANDSENG